MTISSWRRREPEVDASRPTLMTNVYKLSHEREIQDPWRIRTYFLWLLFAITWKSVSLFISTASFSLVLISFSCVWIFFSCLIYVQSSVLYFKCYLHSLLLVFHSPEHKTIYSWRHLKLASKRSLWVQEKGWLQNERSTFCITFWITLHYSLHHLAGQPVNVS